MCSVYFVQMRMAKVLRANLWIGDGRHCIDRRSTSDPFRACQSQSSRPSRVGVGVVVLVIVVNVVVVVVVVVAAVVVNVVVAEIGIRFPLTCQLQSSLHPSRVSS